MLNPTVDLRNLDDQIEEIGDMIEMEDERERAQQLMEDIELEQDLVNEREENRMALTASATKRRGKNTGERILGRLGLHKGRLRRFK